MSYYMLTLVAIVVVVFGFIALSAASASPYYGHGINMDEACRMTWGDTGHLVTSAYGNPSDAGSWYCRRRVSDAGNVGVKITSDRKAEVSAEWGNANEV